MGDGISRSADQPRPKDTLATRVTRRSFLQKALGAIGLGALAMQGSRIAQAAPESPGGPPQYTPDGKEISFNDSKTTEGDLAPSAQDHTEPLPKEDNKPLE